MGEQQTTQETLDLLKLAGKTPDLGLAKAFTQSGSATSGITAYDLEPAAKKLYPVITPLRNQIARVSGKGGIQAAWRGVTGINTNGMSAGVGGGNRGGVIATTTHDYTASYKGLGLDDFATFEADYASEGFDDIKALTVEGLLRSLMIQEERIIFGGNSSTGLGVTPTPSASGSITGGTLNGSGSVDYKVWCVALTLEGYLNASIANGVTGLVSRTNADRSVDTYGGGAAGKSAAAGTATVASGSTGSFTATVTVVAGAVAYAWFWGTTGNELLGAITTINSVLVTATATGTQNISAVSGTDYSQNGLVYDGLLAYTGAGAAAGGSYRVALATGTAGVGSTLTADGAGGVVEIDAAFKSFWDNYRLSPDTIWVGSQEQTNISKKVLAGAANGAQRFVFDSQQGSLAGGTMVRSYLNKYSMDGAQEVPIKLHPNCPPGTILFTTNRLPYPLSNVSSVLRIVARREYYQIEWPQISRKYEYGVYMDGVLQNYFPPAFGVITNITNG
jgi:hypothetical protein